MNTLRAFAAAIVEPSKDDVDGEPAVYSKPDTLSDSFELRRLTTRGSRPRTDFFELYWAHRMPVATWSRLWEWLRLLMFRRAAAIPKVFRGVWLLSWIIFAVVALCLAASIFFFLFPALDPGFLSAGAIKWPIGLTVLGLVLQGFVLAYIGDAAVYLSPHPRNVEARHAIRTAGVSFLQRLHDTNEYDRVVIVGHSLGSVIGYDIIIHAWQRHHEKHNRADAPEAGVFQEAEAMAGSLHRAGPVSDDDLKAWRGACLRLWKRRVDAGSPWLVTDFITLGSPLAHADLLLANEPEDFTRRTKQRELPTCPPVLEKNGVFSFPVHYQSVSDLKRTTFIPHHAACFGLTRWTNLYFPCHGFFFGDVIGGPVAPLFGRGVRDIAVSTKVRNGWLAHTSYWRIGKRQEELHVAVMKLRDALDLGQREW